MNEPDVVSEPPADKPRSPNLFDLMAEETRSATDGRLVAYCIVGVLGIAALFVASRSRLVLILPLLVVGLVGVWGIMDRETRVLDPSASRKHRLLRVAMAIAVVSGSFLAFASVLLIITFAFEHVIS